MMNDESIMPFGQYKGEKMANVPSSYLLWLYENNRGTREIQEYVKENLDVIKSDIALKRKSKI